MVHVFVFFRNDFDDVNQKDIFICSPTRPSVCLPAGEEQNEPKTHLELMAEMRDYKRRRQSYRAKNVHITKKSYTEVLPDLLVFYP